MRVTPYSGDAAEMRLRRVEFFQDLLLHLFGHAGRFDFLAQLLDITLAFVAFAELLLNGLELFAQVKLALVL